LTYLYYNEAQKHTSDVFIKMKLKKYTSSVKLTVDLTRATVTVSVCMRKRLSTWTRVSEPVDVINIDSQQAPDKVCIEDVWLIGGNRCER